MARDPRYSFHKRSGLAFVRLNGKQHYLGKHGSDESWAAYHRLLAEWRSNGRSVPTPQATLSTDSSASITVAEVVDQFLRWAKQHYRHPDGTCTHEYPNVEVATRPVRELYGKTPAADFGPKALKAVREHLVNLKSKRTRKRLSRNWINKRVRIIRRMFKWAVGEELVPPHVLNGLQAVRDIGIGRLGEDRETDPVEPVAWARVQAALPHMNRQIRAMVLLQWFSGMRPGEVIVMRTQDVDRAGDVWLYTPARHKNAHRGQKRLVPLGPEAQNVLRPFLRADGGYLFSPREADAELRAQRHEERKTPVQPSQKLRHRQAKFQKIAEFYDRDAYARAITRACDKAKVERWSPNQLRHAAATRLRREMGIEAARVVLGHTSATTTEIYAEVDRLKAIEAMRKLG